MHIRSDHTIVRGAECDENYVALFFTFAFLYPMPGEGVAFIDACYGNAIKYGIIFG